MLFLFFLLYSVLKIDQVTIFTIGLTGVGKSANGNAFIQKNVMKLRSSLSRTYIEVQKQLFGSQE